MSAQAIAPARYGWMTSREAISAVSQSGAMNSTGIRSLALHRTSERHPQKSPNERPRNSTTAMVSLGTTLSKLRQDGRHEIRAVLECREGIAGRCRRGGVPLGVGSLGDALQHRRWIEARRAGAQVQIPQGHEPVPVVHPLIVDRSRHDPALQPLGSTALLQDAGCVGDVITQEDARLSVVDDAADQGAVRCIGTRVAIAYLIEGGEDLIARTQTDRSRGTRGMGKPPHQIRELSLLRPERSGERAVPRLAPDPDRAIEPFEPLLERPERWLVLHRASRSASFSTSRRATSVFFRRGSRSTPSALTNATSSSSEPNAERGSATSFATTRSSFLSRSIRPASAAASPVSALKPMTIVPGRRVAMIALNRSGFSTRRSLISLPRSFFFIFLVARSIGR